MDSFVCDRMGVFTDNITIILYHPRSSWFQNHINDASAELNIWFMLYCDRTVFKKLEG
jgi:hypothetical protein